MIKAIYKNSGIWGKLLLLLLVSLFFSIIGMALVSILFKGAGDIHSLKLSQFILSIFTLFLPPILAGYLWYERPLVSYSLTTLPGRKQTLLALLLIFTIGPFINLLAYLNEQLVLPEFLSSLEDSFRATEDRINALTKQMLQADNTVSFMFNLFVIAMLPALGEELFCRGALQNIFAEKWNKTIAVWIVAIIFSLIHFQMYGFVPRMVLGGVLGYLLIWSGSMWLPILIHFVNNATIVTVFYLNGDEIESLENIGRGSSAGLGVLSGVLAVYLLWMIYKLRPEIPKE